MTCHICGGNHQMMQTPGIWDGQHCPYDPEGKAVVSKPFLGKQFSEDEPIDEEVLEVMVQGFKGILSAFLEQKGWK